MNDPGVLIGAVIAYAVIAVVLYVWIGLSLSAVFAKAGEERFKAWVPVWNVIVLLQLGGLSGWLVLLGIVPVLGQLALLVVLIMAYQRINRAFGFGAGMTVLAVLLFPVWSSVLGWGSARWIGNEPVAGPLRRGDALSSLDARVAGAAGPSGPAAPRHAADQQAAAFGAGPRPPVPGFAAPPAPASPSFAPPAPPPPAPPSFAAPPVVVPPPPPAPAIPVPPAPAMPAAPAPVSAAPFAPASAHRSVPEDEQADAAGDPVPATRSAVRAAARAEAADEPRIEEEAELPPGRSQAPFTQTVPTSFRPAQDDAPAPAAPRRAFTPTVGEAPPPIDPFAAAELPGGEPPADSSVPVQSVPAAPAEEDPSEPWAPPASTGPIPVVATRATRFSPSPDLDAQVEASAEVSAVVGAPVLGAPRSARESVSAQHTVPEIPDSEAAFDETILAVRKRPTWMLFPPLGAPVAVTSDVLIIGRRPGADTDFPDAQLVPVSDETRTMSKTHARLERQGDTWTIVDLYSTNGVVLVGDEGAERDAVPGLPERLPERFLLGDAELRLSKKDA